MTWPSAESDWLPWLAQARETVALMVEAVAGRARVLVLCDDEDSAKSRLGLLEGVSLVDVPTNDTWVRDYGPITVMADGGEPVLLDFGFNGWGLKFAADQDNQVTVRLHGAGYLGRVRREVPGLWLEGGSIESDGMGTILTTSACLLSANRNPHLDRAGIEAHLSTWLGAKRVLWLEHGHLAGDDTDAHIDTIARLAPEGTICYVRCDDATDEHFADFAAMEAELRAFRQADGRPYRLVPLPWTRPRYAADGHRLPATYANYLIVNGAVLVPTYADPERDQQALAAVAAAHSGYVVTGVDCTVLIEQHGSLHCMTMQVPAEVWTWHP